MLLGSLLSTCERLNRWRSALQVYQLSLAVLGAKQLQQSLTCCHHLLSTCSKASRWSLGLEVLGQLELAPEALTYAAMMDALKPSCRWRDAVLLVDRMWRQKVVPSGHLQVVQQDLLCRAQAWWFWNRSLRSLVRTPLETGTGDPDEGKVHRLAEASWQLGMAGCVPLAFELLGCSTTFFSTFFHFDDSERIHQTD